jgi:hypothetical protein
MGGSSDLLKKQIQNERFAGTRLGNRDLKMNFLPGAFWGNRNIQEAVHGLPRREGRALHMFFSDVLLNFIHSEIRREVVERAAIANVGLIEQETIRPLHVDGIFKVDPIVKTIFPPQ